MSLLSALTREQLARLAPATRPLSFSTGEHIVRQGERADSVYAVREGAAVCVRRGVEERFELRPGDCFGESALADDEADGERVRRADVVAEGPCSVVQIMADDFQKQLGASLGGVASRNFNRKVLSAM